MNPKKRNRIAVIVVILLVLGIAGGYGVFALASGGDSPPPVALSSEATGSATASAQSLDGTWKLSSTGSFVGYRVREKLSALPAPSQAVGGEQARSHRGLLDLHLHRMRELLQPHDQDIDPVWPCSASSSGLPSMFLSVSAAGVTGCPPRCSFARGADVRHQSRKA